MLRNGGARGFAAIGFSPEARGAAMDVSAMRHLRIAAESGEAAAQFNLGVLYDSRIDDNGYAIESHRADAIRWFLLATASSRGIYRDHARSGYERVATRLTPAQLTKAKRLAGLWRPHSQETPLL